MHESAKQIWRPAAGGLTARAARYPGFGPRADKASHVVIPASAKWLRLAAGELLSLRAASTRGCRAWLAAIDDAGSNALPGLGLSGAPLAPPRAGMFDERELQARLRARGLAPAALAWRALDLEAETPALLRAAADCVVVVAVPEASDKLVSGECGRGLTLEHRRNGGAEAPLPEPLGAVREEFRVQRCTGRAYTVRAGEFIQVIDVDGRQCSDFIAFNTRALEGGHERFLDSTVTRSLIGGAYPLPGGPGGLFDKFYDQDMKPLMSVVQDTVGRHDTFALACTARGYEERGFPGHLNCSDNISAALEPHGVAGRRAWPAINFFFNSWIEPSHSRLRSDEAWSRPGDYVLLRALTDLVCVSTACPDDIDPINGWNPTDVHVRVYRPEAPVQVALAYRPTADAEPLMTRPSPFHERTSALTRNYAAARDLWLPQVYEASGAVEEYWACRNAVTIQDLSSLRKIDVCGPDAERLLQRCLTRDARRLAVGRGFYALVCDERGAVVDDGTLFRLAPDLFRWCCGSDDSALMLAAEAERANLHVWLRDVTSTMCNIAVQGPLSREVLEPIIFTQPSWPRLANLRWFGAAVGRLYDRDGQPFMIARSGYTGELGFELFCDQRDALAVWDAVMSAGLPHGIVPMGAQALEMMRIEAGLMAAGAEFGNGEDPDEAGMGFAVDLRNEDFIGRAAIERNRAAPRRRLVGLHFEGDEVPRHGDRIYDGRQGVGVITSAMRSPQLSRVIAMARLAVEMADEGRELEVGVLDGHMKRRPARVVGVPFIDPERAKPRA